MSVNKKNRSLWGSRSEAQRIYYQRQTIKRLEKENNQLKLDFELYKDNHIYKNYEVERKDIVIKELRSWLEERVFYLNSVFDRDIYEEQMMLDFSNILIKLNELEGGKNERKSK